MEDKIFSITLDNASVNDSLVSYLKANLLGKNLLLRKGQLLHDRCAAHVLNLIVQEGLKTIGGAVDNIRDSVKYVKSLQSRKQRYEEIVAQVGISCEKSLSLDVATRWNSTFLMIEMALQFRRAFDS